MKSLNNNTIGRITIAAGISSLIGSIALIEFIVAGNSGLLSDYISIFTAGLMLPLMIALGKIAMTKQENLGRGVLILGVLGTLINFVGGIINVIALEGFIEYYRTADWIYVGGGLVGIAILTFALLNRTNPELKASYVWFSVIFGLAMCTYFLGLVFRDELNAIMEFSKSIAEASPGLLLMFIFGSPFVIIGQPIWLLWTGRLFLKKTETVVDLQVSTQ
jgi:hypothetical protein